MSGNTPRKFSEKIALHTQKQAEETAAFEKIMREVMDVQKPTPAVPTAKPGENLLTAGMNPSYRAGGSLPNVNQMALEKNHGVRIGLQHSISPRSSRNPIGPVRVEKRRTVDHAPYASPPNISNISNVNNICVTLPYVNPLNYLSPPVESAAWRRANSDSALNSLMIPSTIPDSSEESSNNSNDVRDATGSNQNVSNNVKQETPNSVQNAGPDGQPYLEIPSSVSTGSLPDLTNMQFRTQSHQQPLELEDQNLNHSPYSTSPSISYSPNLSPHTPLQSMGVNQIVQQSPQQSIPCQTQAQFTNAQGITYTISGRQLSQSISLAQNSQPQNIPNKQRSPENSASGNASFQSYNQNDNMLHAYRSPQRPSPLSSPLPFCSPSPSDGQLSAPPSPVAQPPVSSPVDTSLLTNQAASALQRDFEQITMMDSTKDTVRSRQRWQEGGLINPNTFTYSNSQFHDIPSLDLGGNGYSQNSPQNPQPDTPQTPSTIPDIVFTDFSDGRAISDPIEDFISEAAAAAFREGLGTIDLDGLQMLADPDLIPLDPQAEDTFRLDRL